VRSGAHPRHWPDFQASIDSFEKGVREGKVMVMAVVEDASAPVPTVGPTILYGRGEQSRGTVTINGVTGVAAGLVKLRPPAHVRRALLSSRTTADRLWGDYVSPVAKKFKQAVYGEEATGTDFRFLSLFKGEMERVRKERASDDDWLLELLFVHPAYQGHGVARALLQHCQALAESPRPLEFPYPSPYTHKTLVQPKLGQSSNVSTSSSSPSPSTPLTSNTCFENLSPQVAEPRKVRMFVEASQAGTPVYTRLGFRPIYRSSIEYEGEQVSWPVMLWEGYVSGTQDRT